jgi:threonyl-tRNA synthetase
VTLTIPTRCTSSAIDGPPARRGRAKALPRHEDRDRPRQSRTAFYYDFEFPEPIGEEALEKIEAEIQRELDEGARVGARRGLGEQAKKLFAEEGEEYKVELVDTAEGDISLYTQGDFTDLCRGPHLQDSKPIKASS